MSCKHRHKIGNLYVQIGDHHPTLDSIYILAMTEHKHNKSYCSLITMQGGRWSDPPQPVEVVRKITLDELNQLAHCTDFNKKFRQINPKEVFNREVL